MIYKHKPIKGGVLPARYGSFDCETEGLYGKARLICMVLNDGTEHVFEGDDCVIEFVNEVTRRPYRGYHLYAHNLSFDMEKTFGAVFGNTLDNKKFELQLSGSKLISAKYCFDEKNSLHLHDTVNLIPRKLSEIGKDLGYPKLKTPDKWLSGDPVEEITPEDIEYCMRDCEIVLKILDTFEEMLRPFKIKLRNTIAANAKAVWKAIYLKDKGMFVDEKKDERFRESYFGGRVEVFVKEHSNTKLYHYDANSLYPSVMLDKYPNPDKLKYTNDLDEALRTREGCACITVEAPKNIKYPVLPVKTDKLLFPLGIIEKGVYNFPEIRLAISKGYKVLETHWVLSSKPMDSPFKGYVKYFTNLKIQYHKDEKHALRLLVKLMLNSLYGKFAQRVDAEERYTKDMPDVGVPFQRLGKNSYRLKDVEKERGRETVVCWSSYAASYARCTLYNFFPQTGLYYCDTDSVFRTTPIAPELVDDYELGFMKLEDVVAESYFVAPKRYAYKTDDGVEVKKVKGIHNDIVQKIPLETFGAEFGVFYDKPVKIKTAILNDVAPYSREKVRKTLSASGEKRIFKDGDSIPITLS